LIETLLQSATQFYFTTLLDVELVFLTPY